MPKLKSKFPSYRHHKRSGQAVVTLSGKDYYLGPHGTDASRIKYERLIARWIENGRKPIDVSDSNNELSSKALLAAYWRSQKQDCKDKELEQIKIEIVHFLDLFEGKADELAPSRLTTAAEKMRSEGVSHGEISKGIDRVQAIYRWGAERKLVLASVADAIESVVPPTRTVVEVCDAYWEHCKGYYVKDGEPTAEQAGIKAAMKRLKEEFRMLPVSDLGPLRMQELQQRFVRDGVSRYYVNKSINRLKRMFRWATAQELIPPSISQAINSVSALKKGRTRAYELKPVPPVDDATVEATLKRIASPVTRDMVLIQRHTGMRPGELFVMRPKDVDRNGPDGCWIYRPARHKTEHHGQSRIVVIGPKAQKLLVKYLLRSENECCFMTERGKQYNRSNYRDRIRHACQMAFPAPKGLSAEEAKAWEKDHRWRPNQLRHSLATEVRKVHGLEAVQAALGHADMKTSQIYAERMMHLAVIAIKDVG